MFVKNKIMVVKNAAKLTVHVDVLTQLDQLHLCGHVAHRSHEITQILTADQSVLVLIKLVECITQLCGKKRASVRTVSAITAQKHCVHCTCKMSEIIC